MPNPELIEKLNRALSLELAAVIQYMQHSYLITGTEREVYRSFFREQSKEAREHALTLGDRIVALEGVPTVEPSTISQSVNLVEMLEQDLALEREAMAAYMGAWEACDKDTMPTRFMLEERIYKEQMHIDELEKLTSERTATVTTGRITLRQVASG
jgi:bacterioferritin